MRLRPGTQSRRTGFASLCVCALMFVGCLGRSPDVRHFTLGTQHVVDAAERAPDLAVLIGPIRLPDYLDRAQIVRRSGGGEIRIDEFNRWLGGFEKVLTAALATEVRRQLGSVRVVGYPSQAPFSKDYSVRIHVDEWVVDASNTLSVKLRWAIDGVGPKREAGDRGTRSKTAPSLSSYISDVAVNDRSVEALVEAHDRAVAELASRLADELVAAASNP